MKKNLLFCLLAVITWITFGCSKKKDDPKSKKELLTQKEWKYVSVKYRANSSDPWEDVLATAPACAKDDRLIFKTDGTYIIDNGQTKCSPGDSQTVESGTWYFTDNETKIAIQKTGGSAVTWEILQLDGNTLKCQFHFLYYFEQTFGH